MNTASIDYYDKNADAYISATTELDVSHLQELFLALLPSGGKILDAGCGSGRDSLAFLKAGFDVEAIDGSAVMVERASKFTGLKVRQLTFQQIEYRSEFDGIWACASLLHVPFDELPAVLSRMHTALKPQGVLYGSFKYGDSIIERDGRFFTNCNEARLKNLQDKVSGFSGIKTWKSNDIRKGRSSEQWINFLWRAV
ncbi:MAG: methyltransferase domain-containing protein [Bdellovibrionales bacterium]|nr:methyltransferase domain-containing protein [Bdellovibrionales bacterium]